MGAVKLHGAGSTKLAGCVCSGAAPLSTYFREMRAIVAQSQPVETVALATFQLVQLSGDDTT